MLIIQILLGTFILLQFLGVIETIKKRGKNPASVLAATFLTILLAMNFAIVVGLMG